MLQRGAKTFKAVLIAAGFRPPSGYPRMVRVPIRFGIGGALANASTTYIDLTQGWSDINVLRAAGVNVPSANNNNAQAAQNNPPVVVLIEKAAFVLRHPTTVTDAQVAAQVGYNNATNLVHQPSGSDPREIPLQNLLDDTLATNAIGAQSAAVNAAGVDVAAAEFQAPVWRKPSTSYLAMGSLWADLQHDSLGIKPTVSFAIGTPGFNMYFEGAAFSNTGWIASDAGGQCDDTEAGTLARLSTTDRRGINAARVRVERVLATLNR